MSLLILFSCVEQYMSEALEKNNAAGEPSAKFDWNFNQLNRLRQAVDHPLNLFPIMKEIPPKDTQNLKDRLTSIKGKTDVYEFIYEQVEPLSGKRSGGNANADSKTQGSHSDKTQPHPSDSSFDMTPHFEFVLKSQDNEGCIACFKELNTSNTKVLKVSY